MKIKYKIKEDYVIKQLLIKGRSMVEIMDEILAKTASHSPKKANKRKNPYYGL